MFDSTYVLPTTQHHHHTTNIEMKPHDAADAARLYGQLEEKAKKAVAGALVETLDNEIKLVKASVADDPIQGTAKVRLIFSINGEMHDVTLERADDISDTLYTEVARELMMQLSRKLSMHDSRVLLNQPIIRVKS